MKNIIVLLLLVITCTTGDAQKITPVQWIIGTWKIQTPQGMLLERWQVKDDSTLQSRSYFVKANGDSVEQEVIQIALRHGDWYYIPTVANQNDGKPVRFKMIYLKGTEFISENPEHDFPQRIAYRRIRQSLFASIEGKRDGRYNKQNFDFNISE